MSRALSAREKTLVAIVLGGAFLFGNFVLGEWAWKTIRRAHADLAAHRQQLRHAASLSSELEFWEKRDAWLAAKQPTLASADTAGVLLLDDVKELAKRHGVLLQNPTIRNPDRQTEYVAVAVELETKSAWLPLTAFLYELQGPERFIAIETANLRIDATDATQMRGLFKIARWYAPR